MFYSDSSGKYLSVADVLNTLNQADQNRQSKRVDLTAKITTLQTKLASASQNDIVTSIQNFADQVRQLSTS